MPVGPCGGCGKQTNSATSNWWFTEDHIPTKCYARHVDGKWERGCGYDGADPFDQTYADKLISGKPILDIEAIPMNKNIHKTCASCGDTFITAAGSKHRFCINCTEVT